MLSTVSHAVRVYSRPTCQRVHVVVSIRYLMLGAAGCIIHVCLECMYTLGGMHACHPTLKT